MSDLVSKLILIRNHLEAAARAGAKAIDSVPEEWRPSVTNFIHYLALRQWDLRRIQLELADQGVSSLGRAEGYVLGNLNRVISVLQDSLLKETSAFPYNWSSSEALLHEHTHALFGVRPKDRHVYIMVTAPDATIATEHWMRNVIQSGANILRINSAHGNLSEWQSVATAARKVAAELNTPLKILVDLPGPKLRLETGVPPHRVLKVKPTKDEYGHLKSPAIITLIGIAGEKCEMRRELDRYVLALPQPLFISLRVGDRIKFTDARKKHREIILQSHGDDNNFLATIEKAAYISPTTEFKLVDDDGRVKERFCVPHLPMKPFTIRLDVGDLLRINQTANPSESRNKAEIPHVFCPEPAFFRAIQPGHTVMLDDGKIVANVVQADQESAIVSIREAVKGFAAIRDDMGINLIDSDITGSAVGPDDQDAIQFAREHADMVGISFLRSAQDVWDVCKCLQRNDIGLILKIESKAGFAALPGILLETLGRHKIGIMIARGDLAVECGFERLAELQEEIMWFGEAAHIPVIWATQVLESVAKTGFATRAEITDAAMSVRAECVMLNKGPYIDRAVQILDSILRRMELHQYKKRQLFRPLNVPVPEFVRDSMTAP